MTINLDPTLVWMTLIKGPTNNILIITEPSTRTIQHEEPRTNAFCQVVPVAIRYSVVLDSMGEAIFVPGSRPRIRYKLLCFAL